MRPPPEKPPAQKLATLPGAKTPEEFSNLNKWTYLLMQFVEANTYLELAQGVTISETSGIHEVLAHQAFFKIFLISYVKCFRANKGRTGLDAKDVFPAGGHASTIHAELVDYRNRFGAHSDNSGLEDASIEVIQTPEAYHIWHRYAAAFPIHRYAAYRDLLKIMEERIVEKVEKAKGQLEIQLGKPIIVQGFPSD